MARQSNARRGERRRTFNENKLIALCLHTASEWVARRREQEREIERGGEREGGREEGGRV